MNRIFFKNNPYPKGHQIKEFVWSGRLEKDRGFIFDFHLKTDNYYAEDNSENDSDEDLPNWDAKIVWSNYHSCSISSTKWGNNGVVVGNKEKQFDFGKLLDKKLIVDTIPDSNDVDFGTLAFHIYLLGHDACANHEISFTKQYDNSTFDIEWNGNIALVYSGDNEFDHSFESKISKVKFNGICFDSELNQQANEELLKSCVIDYEAFEIIGNKFQLK